MSRYLTPSCPVCKEPTVMELDPIKVLRWQSGEKIQVVWPEMSVDDRELMQTGLHSPDCWDAHVPDANHRDPLCIEERAPGRA